ncbi:hypothetical protein BpHYR1_016904 [Brachionus plicatilis]|uniref:Uncharacterized protein n=1 Tax=Brachionus plicatilis TaxID=10195 RepID=A0A3M7RGD2_BRAPC|nr:hypothetical protein BpHYR1_016904 [Brachionus plicatilis]
MLNEYYEIMNIIKIAGIYAQNYLVYSMKKLFDYKSFLKQKNCTFIFNQLEQYPVIVYECFDLFDKSD